METHERADDAAVLRMVKARLATVYHDLSNPLAVASGNVQFMTELVRMGDREGLAEALADVQSAIEMFETRLSGLLELRRTLDAHLMPDGSTREE